MDNTSNAQASVGINTQNAGLFSAAAYTPIGTAVDLTTLPPF